MQASLLHKPDHRMLLQSSVSLLIWGRPMTNDHHRHCVCTDAGRGVFLEDGGGGGVGGIAKA